MKIGLIAVLAASTTVLAGCAAKTKSETVKTDNGSSIEVFSGVVRSDLNNNRIGDSTLRIVSPSTDTVGKGLAVLSVLTGSFNSGDFDKENYKGTSVDTLKNPTDSYLGIKAKQNIKKWMSENASGYVYKQPLYTGYATWALIYSDASKTEPTYQLKYKVYFYKRPESANMFSAFTVKDCAPTPVSATLHEWQANNYQKVTLETQRYMDACLLELNNQLPVLLKK